MSDTHPMPCIVCGLPFAECRCPTMGWEPAPEPSPLEASHARLLAALETARECIAYCRRSHPDSQSGEGVPVEIFIDAAIKEAKEL